jgi:DNA repair protein RadC
MQALMIKAGGRYRQAVKDEILSAAIQYAVMDGPRPSAQQPRQALLAAKQFIGSREHESFYAMWLDARNRVIAFDELFSGTIDASPVFPREVVKRALERNAVSVIFCHNHPSGSLDPSPADDFITRRLKDALALIEIRVTDHLIITATGHYSMAEHGMI